MEYRNKKKPTDILFWDSAKGVLTWTTNHRPDALNTYISVDKTSSMDVHWGKDGNSPTPYWN